MLSFLKRRRTVLLFLVSLSAVSLYSALTLLLKNISSVCLPDENACYQLWQETLSVPFVFGLLLKSIIVAPLLVLFTSRRGFMVWVTATLLVVPFALAHIFFMVPTSGFMVSKLGYSNLWGIVYFTLTLAIAVGVPLIEYIVRRVRGV